MTKRLTDEELEELERMEREASDDWTGVYDAYNGVSTLKTGRITLTSDATDARDDVFMACVARNALRSLIAEVREMRKRVKAVGQCLSDNGCDCDCGHNSAYDDHEEDCELCLACRVNDALEGVVSR